MFGDAGGGDLLVSLLFECVNCVCWMTLGDVLVCLMCVFMFHDV